MVRQMLILLIILALVYAFLNGFRDSSSILAGVLASRAMHPRWALYLAALAEFVAPFLFGTAVARAIATGLVDPEAITLRTVVVAMMAALSWTLIAWRRGIPSSSSHALIGGLLGAALVTGGAGAIQVGGLVRVVLPLFLVPPLGLVAGFLIMALFLKLFRYASPKINTGFRRIQVFTMVGLALAHSANDAQKSMGIIALGLVLAGKLAVFRIPPAVVLICAAAIALGAARGDWRLIRTLGGKIYRIRPMNALASQTAASGLVLFSALSGAPVSTSQVIAMALMGSGAAERVNKVRWQVGVDMLITWGVTIPAAMILAMSYYLFIVGLEMTPQVAALVIRWLVAG